MPTFFEARALADEAGVGADEFTEEMYNAQKSNAKETYEANLGSFFEGTGYTGNLAKGGLIRRNYAFGDPDEYPEEGDDLTIFEIIKEQGIPVGEQVRDKKIDVGAKSIQLAKITDKQRQQMDHDWRFLKAGAYDLNDLWENAKGWDDTGSKGFWGMGKKEAEPMTKEEFKEEMLKRGYLNVPGSNKSIEDFDRLKIKKGGRVNYTDGSGIFGKKIKWENLNKDQKKWLRENQNMHNVKIPPEEKAQGGRIGYEDGTPEIPEGFLEDLKRQDFEKLLDKYRRRQELQERKKDYGPGGQNVAQGGRIGFDEGSSGPSYERYFKHKGKIHKAYDMAEKSAEAEDIDIDDEIYSDNKAHDLTNFFKNRRIRKALIEEGHDPDKIMRELLVEQMKSETGDLPSYALGEELQGYSDLFRKGGRAGYALGTPLASEGGLGGLPVEADLRYTGGFMPYGEKEKGDDVPARLSKNEFVFTADAVRAAGGGSMQKGAQRMYNTMKMLEGQVA